MELFKYIPSLKFREITASVSIYVALAELFALGEFSRWVISIFRPISRKLWEVTFAYLPLDVILTVKEKDALTALLLFTPLGLAGIYHLLFSRNKNEIMFRNNENKILIASIIAWLFFLVLLFDVIVLEKFSQHDGYKIIFGIEVLKYLAPMALTMIAIFGFLYFYLVINNNYPIIIKLFSWLLIGLSIFTIFLLPTQFPGIVGVSLFLILIFIIISVRYCPKSYVSILIVAMLMAVTGLAVDIIQNIGSQI